MITDAQKNDKELQEKIPLIKDGVESEFLVKDDGSLYFRDILYVLADSELTHINWWKGMKRYVVDYVFKCLTCQQVKAEHQVP